MDLQLIEAPFRKKESVDLKGIITLYALYLKIPQKSSQT